MTHISLRNNTKLSNLTVREFLCIQTEYKIDSKPRMAFEEGNDQEIWRKRV